MCIRDRAVPIAPALKILQHGSRLAKYFWSLVPILPGRDKNYQDYLFDYDVCYHDTPVKNIEDLNHLALLAKRDLKKITCPLLVVKAGQDQSVHPDAPKWIIPVSYTHLVLIRPFSKSSSYSGEALEASTSSSTAV